MKKPLSLVRGAVRQLVLLGFILSFAQTASALIVGPYTPDADTLHLWHLDETAVPAVDAVSPGGTNLTALGGGATLGNPSFTGFGAALSTVDGGQADVTGAGRDAYLSALPLVNGAADNISTVFADPVTGAFTMEAIVHIQFDPTVNFGTVANGGNGRNAAFQIITGEDEANPGRLFQFRLAPIGTANPLNFGEPMLEFINVRQAAAGQVQNVLVPIPISGDDAIVSNNWYHVAVTYDGSAGTPDNLKFYWTRMDASRTAANLIGSMTLNNDLAVAATDFAIGNIGRNPSQNAFLGLIDEVRISKVARGPGQMMFAAPNITFDQQPANFVAAISQPASFSVTANGIPPLFYQWRHAGTNLPAATNSTYLISGVTLADAGNYDVVVTNLVSPPATSAVAVLTVRTPVNLVWSGTATDWDTTGIVWDSNGDLLPDAAFIQGDNVRFDVLGAASPFVNLTANLNPVSVVVSNELGFEYTFTTFTTGSIGSNARLVKQGEGTLTVDTDNLNTGGTLIEAGLLQVGAFGGTRGSLGSGPVTNHAALAFNRATALTVPAAITGTGYLAQNGATTITLTATNNSWSGGTLIGGGTLQIGNGGDSGSLGSGPITNLSILAINTSRSFDLANVISEIGSVTITGGGTHNVTAVNTYSGGTTIAGNSVVRPGNNDALGTGTVAVGNNNQNQSRLELAGGLTLVNTLAIGPRAYLPTDATPQNSAAHFVNVSGTNTLGPPTDLTLAAGGNVLALQSDAGKLVLSVGINWNANGTRYVLLKGEGEGEIQGPLTQAAAAALSLHKSGGGTWTLTGTSDLRGPTIVSNGTLVVNGQLTETTNLVNAFGGTLAGNGTIAGPVTVAAGGTLSPGASIGTLTINNSLTLEPGSVTSVEVNKTSQTSDQVVGVTSATYGGTLVVSNQSGTLALGDSFTLFSAAASSGNFSNITPAPGAGLAWSFNPATGVLSVVAVAVSQPVIGTVSVVGADLVFSGANGVAGNQYVVLSSTNVAAPPSSWERVQTNAFGPGGVFNVTNAVAPGVPHRFYRLQLQ